MYSLLVKPDTDTDEKIVLVPEETLYINTELQYNKKHGVYLLYLQTTFQKMSMI